MLQTPRLVPSPAWSAETLPGGQQVEAVGVHDLDPGLDEVPHEQLLIARSA
jgi:hypothetical protein